MIKRAVAFVLGAPIAYALAAVLGGVVPNGAPASGPGTVEVRLIQGPIHTDFMLPVTDETRAAFAFLTDAGLPLPDPRAEWIVVGWGAGTFYTTVATASDLTLPAVGRGVFGDSGVLRFDIWPDVPLQPGMSTLNLTPDQVTALVQSIRADVVDTAPVSDVTFNGGDRFFPAAGRFHIFRTCNVWFGAKLRQAGVRFGAWTPILPSVDLSLWWFQG